MDFSAIRRVVQEQEKDNKAVLGSGGLIERDVDLPSLKNLLSRPNALFILGVRRCGKSTLALMLAENSKYACLNFDDESLYGLGVEDLNEVLKAFYDLYGDVETVVFDEIQDIAGWELFINRLRRTKKIIITGSNSKLLSGELASRLTGRHVDYALFPFSFSEYCRYRKINLAETAETQYTTKTSALMEKTLGNYLLEGGFPESYVYGKKILKTIFHDIISKDIISRHRTRKDIVEQLAGYLINASGKEITYRKLSNIFEAKAATISKYAGYFKETYLFFTVERFSYKLKESIIAPKKIYCVDTGLINAVSPGMLGEGRLLENMVYIELLRRSQREDSTIYYWKNAAQQEVDFAVRQGGKITELIQVTKKTDDEDVKRRELRSLIQASSDLGCGNLKIISMNKEGEEKHEGKIITFIPAWKYLLGNQLKKQEG